MRRSSLLLATMLLASTLSVAASPAAADGDARASRGHGVAAPATNHVKAGYWTAGRMAAAQDRDVMVRPADPQARPPGGNGGGGGKGGGKPGSGSGGVTGEHWTGGGLVQATVGKVYFTLGGSNYVCSGTTVDTTSGDLVLTAGHCLYDEGVGYATNFTFVPDHDPDGAAYGLWDATQLITTTGWQSGDFDYDVGFAIIEEKNGQSIADVVGGQGIAFNRPRGESMYAFGYPAARPYDGGDLIHCAGTVVDDPYGATTQGMTCDMTGGSSGGGWMADFSTATGAGLLNGVNSYKYGSKGKVMYSPYFGPTIQNLYVTAEALGS